MDTTTFRAFNRIINSQGECSKAGGAWEQSICKIVNSIPGLDGSRISANLINITKCVQIKDLIEILKVRYPERLGDTFKHRTGLSVGTSDYLPFSFLERGLRCGASVCIIRRRFVLQDICKRLEERTPQELPAVMEVIAKEGFGISDAWDSDDTRKLSEIIVQSDSLSKTLQTQAHQIIEIPYATGFLVGSKHLLTNYHVFFDADEQILTQDKIQSFIAEFQYERNSPDSNRQPFRYAFGSVYAASEELDYLLIELSSPSLNDSKKEANPGEIFGWLPLHNDSKVILPFITEKIIKIIRQSEAQSVKSDSSLLYDRREIPGDCVCIIQHPRGRQKEIVLFNNQVQELYTDFFKYQADADFGSSGSPVLDRNWRLVGLHHASLLKWINETDNKEGEIEVLGNLGVRVSSIVNHLLTNPDWTTEQFQWIKEFTEKYVIRDAVLPEKPRVFISIGRDRRSLIGSDNGLLELETMKSMKKEIQSAINQLDSHNLLPITFEFVPDGYLEEEQKTIEWIKKQSLNFLKDFAIEITMDSLGKEINDPIATIYYARYILERRNQGDMLLQAIQAQTPGLFNRGANSDLLTQPGRLSFCRKLSIPSLVLYLGNVESVQTSEFIENNKAQLSKGLLDGLITWVQAMSPYGVWMDTGSNLGVRSSGMPAI
jgi:V8-like Glu-specific endopeptidase